MTRDDLARLPRLLLLAGAALIAGPPTARPQAPAAPPPASAPAPEVDASAPPRGAPEDVALWEAMGAMHARMQTSRHWAVRTLTELQASRLDLRLDAAAKEKGPPESARLDALRGRFVEAWQKDYLVLTRRWPVDPRLGCRRQRLDLESYMEAKAPELAVARAESTECLARMKPPTEEMEAANRQLETVLAEVRAALGPSGPAAAPAIPATPAK